MRFTSRVESLREGTSQQGKNIPGGPMKRPCPRQDRATTLGELATRFRTTLSLGAVLALALGCTNTVEGNPTGSNGTPGSGGNSGSGATQSSGGTGNTGHGGTGQGGTSTGQGG